MPEKINTLIVEDEMAALDHLVELVRLDKRLRLCASAKNLREARAALARNEIDLIFLDLNLRGGSGFDLIRDFPAISAIITTARADAAVEAFDLSAVDFLHKPFSDTRFRRAVDKVVAARPEVNAQLFLRAGAKDGHKIIRLADVLYFTAHGKTTRVVTHDNFYLVNQLLGDIEKKLSKAEFIRIHRQHIVKKAEIEFVERTGRTQNIKLRDLAEQLPVGKTFQQLVKAFSI